MRTIVDHHLQIGAARNQLVDNHEIRLDRSQLIIPAEEIQQWYVEILDNGDSVESYWPVEVTEEA